MEFSRATRREPRVLWDEGELEFNKWLEENIDYLNEVLNSSFRVVEREKDTPTGFSIDLVVEDEDNGLRGVIECQLNQSDHSHLGQLLAYSTAYESDIAIWIVQEPRYEHQLTIEWLNEATEKYFYLVTVEAIEVNDALAPLFTPTSVPSPAAKEIGEDKREPNEHNLKQERFWKELLEKSEGQFNLFSTISPKQQGWISKSAGRSGVYYRYRVRNDWTDVGLYIATGSKEENEAVFDELYQQKEEIENRFGDELDWRKIEDKKACRVVYRVSDIGLNEDERWDEIQDQMISNMERFRDAIQEPISNLS